MPKTITYMPAVLKENATCLRADVRWLHNEKFCRVDLEFSDGSGAELRLPSFSIQHVHNAVGMPRRMLWDYFFTLPRVVRRTPTGTKTRTKRKR